ncbi:MAG: PorV/PorQ family protein [Candidatus Eisenbacteria bacterium]
MRLVKLTLAAALLMAIVAAGFAHADINLAGTTAAGFLANGTGPRVLAMGGATLGLGGDLQSAAWNPASLGWMTNGEVTLAHAGLPGDMQQEWLGAGGRFGQSATRWSVQGLYQGNGSFDGRDASNNPTGTFSASSFAVGAQLAQTFGERVTLGFGTKFVSEKLGDVSGLGTTFDFGGQVRTGPFGFGASATNMGGQMRYSGSVYSFPASYGAGVSYSLPVTGLSFAVDANFPKAYYNDVRFGSEWRWHDMVALRAGYRAEMSQGTQDGLSGPTFGIGAGYNGLWFDYGYLVSGESGGSEQRLSISFHPGGFGLGGASMGANGTGASHAPTASTSGAATKGATAANTPADKPASPSTKTTGTSANAAPNARGASATAATADDMKTSKPAKDDTGPASLDKAGPVATVTAVDDAGKTVSASSKTASGSNAKPAAKTPPAATAPAPAAAMAPAATQSEVKSAPMSDTKTTANQPEVKSAPVSDAKTTAAQSEVKSAPVSDAKTAATQPEVKSAPVSDAKTAAPAPTVPAAPAVKNAAAPSASANTTTRPRPDKVTVKSGDTLASIARQYGTSPAAIMMENNMVSETIKTGQKLKLPK